MRNKTDFESPLARVRDAGAGGFGRLLGQDGLPVGAIVQARVVAGICAHRCPIDPPLFASDRPAATPRYWCRLLSGITPSGVRESLVGNRSHSCIRCTGGVGSHVAEIAKALARKALWARAGLKNPGATTEMGPESSI
ncbi:MAG: hypothetical protein CM15mP103_06280 [Gammaproteobacteria bacterium]|nr:MAG: hypothetical protein CM15mP103_06280 [Gammaproteobacteria bacterium]